MAFYTNGLLPDGQTLSLSLDRYASLMRLCTCAFNGIEHTGECCDCNALWTQSDRDALAIALGQAEEMRERELGYFLAPKWIDDEEYEYKYPLILNKKHLIEVGSQICVDVVDIPLTLSVLGVINDPVVFQIVGMTYDISQYHIYYHPDDVEYGELIEVHPLKAPKLIVAGTWQFEIPRCRLVLPSVAKTCEVIDYDDDTNFVDMLKLKRCYTDVSDGALLVWSGCDCAETTQSLCSVIDNKRLSIVKWHAATYSGGVWTNTSILCNSTSCSCDPSRMRVSYLSGRKSSVSTEMETIKLAHTLLSGLIPDRLSPCSMCWSFDQEKDPSNLFTPYGDTRGAIKTWQSDSRAKVGFGTKFPAGW